jgi:ubiquitin carboxyl-terminal hydrolase 35/38
VHSVQAEADNGASDSKRARVDESEAATLLRRFGVDPYFGGLLESVITCAECGLRSATVEPFSFLTLAVPEGKDGERRQLGELLDSFTRPERLVGANSYLCARCNAKREAEKALCVRTPPRCLFICLKRNIYEAGTRERHKIMTQVQFPCLLRLGSAPYVLYSAVIHSGSSAQYGHYYCVARHSTDALRAAQLALSSSLDAGDAERTAAGDAAASPTWMLYNDEAVSTSSFQSLADISRAFAHDVPYALLYRRAAPEDLCALPALTALAAASVPRTIAAEITADNQRLAEEQERHARAQPFGAAGMDSQNDGTPTYYDPDAGDFDASDARRAGGSGPGFQHGPSRHWGE